MTYVLKSADGRYVVAIDSGPLGGSTMTFASKTEKQGLAKRMTLEEAREWKTKMRDLKIVKIVPSTAKYVIKRECYLAREAQWAEVQSEALKLPKGELFPLPGDRLVRLK